eukprot:6183358-Pleurochrysis_carterae.AAC.1
MPIFTSEACMNPRFLHRSETFDSRKAGQESTLVWELSLDTASCIFSSRAFRDLMPADEPQRFSAPADRMRGIMSSKSSFRHRVAQVLGSSQQTPSAPELLLLLCCWLYSRCPDCRLCPASPRFPSSRTTTIAIRSYASVPSCDEKQHASSEDPMALADSEQLTAVAFLQQFGAL